MADTTEIDLRAAINAISDVVQNRPRPLREFDQIYMKTGDMVLQSQLVAQWASGKRLAFIGDGDAISVCVAYLHENKIVNYGPTQIVVYDFDERICGAVNRFADKERLPNLSAQLYNCLDPFPGPTNFDCFYTNPPWGESNEGESVKVFMQRGMEATNYGGEGMVVIADDDASNREVEWPRQVLGRVQAYALESGFYVQRMIPRLHSYHLPDAPELRSCNLLFKALEDGEKIHGTSSAITDSARLAHFYGRDGRPRVKYVRERKRLDYGKASEEEYSFESWATE
jgi:predicted methyltransferase